MKAQRFLNDQGFHDVPDSRSRYSVAFGALVLALLSGGALLGLAITGRLPVGDLAVGTWLLVVVHLAAMLTALWGMWRHRELLERQEAAAQPLRQALVAQAADWDNTADSLQRYEELFERTSDALMILFNDEFIEGNPACLSLFDCDSLDHFKGIHPADLSPPFQADGRPSRETAHEFIQHAIRHGNNRFEWIHRTAKGRDFPAEVQLTAVGDPANPYICAVVRDITNRKQAEAEIQFQAYYDSLTQLPNRRLMLDRINQTLVTSRRHDYLNALLFVDLDRFKLINDSLGHSLGDELLVQIGGILRDQIREEDSVARFGGDEFVILLKHLDSKHAGAALKAERLAEALQQTISRTYDVTGHSIHVTCSIGIYLFPGEDESLDDIIKQADTAMYSAKERGRNQIAFFEATMQEALVKRLTLEKDLRQAVRHGDLEVFFQPQLSTGREVVGIEALARWQHPDHGFIPPDEFIAIAEDIGLIYELGEWVLRRSIEQYLALPVRPPQLSVNISPHQFRHPQFVAVIESVITHYQLPPRSLVLEVTEGVVISDFVDAESRLQQLRSLGVRIALDDFGTGYSSLSYLKRLPIDEIKIDRSFVMDIDRDPQDAQLVKTILDIAHQFQLVTVAEGVENEAHFEFLSNHQCRVYQGYLFTRPLPASELAPYLDEVAASADLRARGESL